MAVSFALKVPLFTNQPRKVMLEAVPALTVPSFTRLAPKVTVEALACNCPSLCVIPNTVSAKLLVWSQPPALMVSGVLMLFAAPRNTRLPLVLAMMTPPVPVQVAGNSMPVV